MLCKAQCGKQPGHLEKPTNPRRAARYLWQAKENIERAKETRIQLNTIAVPGLKYCSQSEGNYKGPVS